MQIITTYKPTEDLKISEGVFKTSLDGLYFLPHNHFKDNRGFFAELGHIYKIEAITKEDFKVAQINHSRSKTFVVRGMHAEGWNKLISVTSGTSFCALADIRPNSPTFSKVETFLLGEGKDCLKGSLFITQGIANSICVVEGPSDYVYLVNKLYKDRDKSGDQAVSVFDKDLKVNWPIEKDTMILSDRDKETVTLRQKFPDKF